MKKKLLLLGLGIVAMVMVGCGQVAQQTGGEVSDVPQVQVSESVLATNKIKISMTQGGGIGPSSVETSIITTQSVEIEANVPGFMTFDAQSSIFFNVDHMGMIVADGVITLNVKYNDLLASTLDDVRVRAYMLSGDGLTGQTQAHVIPLDIELIAQKPYTALTETETDMKIWGKPYDQAINETLVFKLRGDFSHAFNQLYKGTVILDFVRNDEIGDEWEVRTVNVTDRSSTEMLVYDNKLWILGGFNGVTRLNDVWSSEDGVNWTQVTASAPWSPRMWHSAVVYDNKMWVIAGDAALSGGWERDDVWSSTDGINWTRTSDGVLGERSNQSACEFDNKLWVLGGKGEGSYDYKNTTYTTNGSTWMNGSNMPGSSGGRYGHASIGFKGNLFVFGGWDKLFNSHPDDMDLGMLRSSDGFSWTLYDSPEIPTDLISPEVTKDDNYLYLTNGDSGSFGVWKSSDGIVWSQIIDNHPASTNSAFTYFNGKLWLVPGHQESGFLKIYSLSVN